MVPQRGFQYNELLQYPISIHMLSWKWKVEILPSFAKWFIHVNDVTKIISAYVYRNTLQRHFLLRKKKEKLRVEKWLQSTDKIDHYDVTEPLPPLP